MEMRRIAVNGKFLSQKITGTQRSAIEILKALDLIAPNLEIVLLVPKKQKIPYAFQNIKVKKCGIFKGFLWEQISFPIHLFLHRALPMNLCGVCPVIAPKGITVLHDIRNNIHREWMPEKMRAKLSAYWHIFQSYWICRFATQIVTVSKFSKKQIIEYFKVASNRITVIPNGWQHIQAAQTHQDGGYFFSLASIAKHKNFRWVVEVAKRNPKSQFRIAGSLNKNLFDANDLKELPNLKFLGYLTDEEIVSQMLGCKAFLFPSLYEGFGLPPLEALSLGTPVVVSNCASLPEVFGKSAHYIDPFDYNVDLEKLLAEPVAPASEVLDRYNWEKSATALQNILVKVAEGI
jgi:glycosyltransferase involved in cell wall biosynthesis